MNILMQEAVTNSSLHSALHSVALVGDAVDDRGRAAHSYLTGLGATLVCVKYIPGSFQVSIGGKLIEADQLDPMLRQYGPVLMLEATTLGIAEILLLSRAANEADMSGIDYLYVEPESYFNARRTSLLHKRDFDLSERFPGYRPIPGFIVNLGDPRPARGVLFLGYEERRLDRVLEDHQMIDPRYCTFVFGVPAFRPGWEMNSFSRNLRVMRDKQLKPEIAFAGAENPAAAFEVLEEVRGSLRDQERMFVVPIGTKPAGIGAALFCAVNDSVGVLYDHPERKTGRSEAVAKWHYFSARF